LVIRICTWPNRRNFLCQSDSIQGGLMVAEIIKAIQEIAALDFWTRCPIPYAKGDALANPPHILWRFEHPSSDLAAFFREAVDSFRGQLRWELIITERNWVLQPARIREHMRANKM